MMLRADDLRKLFSLTLAEVCLLLEAAFWLGICRLAIPLLPFRWIAPYLGTHMAESASVLDPHGREVPLAVSRAIVRAAWRLPWDCKCLAQAMTGKAMLKRRGVPSTLYLGVAKDKEQLAAHAWLRCGDIILTGGQGKERFTVVSSFGDDIRSRG
ncbi:lasso peptide biosynthesis B2 protein [Geotalea uraniireducens]|uniref:Microcin J25-processing protein McjB C-terminal domain-containing protein n=1 Tax=Geotalea uraniireducens (strain Rf4) TaxID=351605 RepID=A5GA49_GEOUR|nr:lasso peptide biosynthesis B2 protein [Geotalea uraniireducens]ABQ25557.1 hypothetical protein Gura_1356 [Geotalea uraniireducens Rf4]